jgi:hypothetical protein
MTRARLLLPLLLLAVGAPALAADVTVTLDAGSGFVVEDNTATTERLRVDEATGNVSRNGALFVHTTGTSTFVGAGAGNLSTTGFGNAAFGEFALRFNTTGGSNSVFGRTAAQSNTSGNFNSVFGSAALNVNQTGGFNSVFGANALVYNTASSNSAFGYASLKNNSTGAGNSAFGRGSLAASTTGINNTAVGFDSMSNGGGSANTAVGYRSLRDSTGGSNSAFGEQALLSNTTGIQNTAVGSGTMTNNEGGFFNTAVGVIALSGNSSGSFNSALGWGALAQNTTGGSNLALGSYAGDRQTTGSDNIYLVNRGAAAESGQIKIGIVGTHTDAFIAGIAGNTVTGSNVVVDVATGELGFAPSSGRFKEQIEPLGSTQLMQLEPVRFRYREDAVGARGAAETQYGLIAEQVTEVAPELVVFEEDGTPFTVRYQMLAPMLLSEVQRQRSTIEALQARIERLEGEQGVVSAKVSP